MTKERVPVLSQFEGQNGGSIKVRKDKIIKMLSSTYKVKDIILNKPRDRAHFLKRLQWAYQLIGYIIVEKRKKDSTFLRDKEFLRLVNNIKMIMGGAFRDITGKKVEDFDMEWEEQDYYSSKSLEANFVVWFMQEVNTNIKKYAKKPKELLAKTWPAVLKFYNKIKIEQGRDYYWTKFLEKISGRDNPKLTLKEQRILLTKGAPDFIWQFLTGTENKPDLKVTQKLNPKFDLFMFPTLPTGGRISQTIPETMLVNFYRKAKEQVLGTSFPIEKLMNFIKRFIGDKTIKRWTKVDIVYRVGVKANRKWLPAAITLKGTKSFLDTWSNTSGSPIKYPIVINYGKCPYFDLYHYMNFLIDALKNTEYKDPEEEVLIQSKNLTKLKKEIVIEGYDVSKGGYYKKDGTSI